MAVTLNISKLQYKTRHTTFFGTTFRSDGHKAEHEKVQAINKMPQQTNVKRPPAFLGYGQLLK